MRSPYPDRQGCDTEGSVRASVARARDPVVANRAQGWEGVAASWVRESLALVARDGPGAGAGAAVGAGEGAEEGAEVGRRANEIRANPTSAGMAYATHAIASSHVVAGEKLKKPVRRLARHESGGI